MTYAMTKTITPKHPAALAARTLIALWSWLAADIVMALGCIWEIYQLHGLSDDEAMQVMTASANAPLTPAEIAGIPYVLMSVIAGAFILRWIYVVNRNTHSWSEAPLMSPGWNVGWFFVPVASLWKPYQGVRQTWAATIDPARPDAIATPHWLKSWWRLWVATLLLGNLTFRLALAADTRDDLVTVDLLYAAAILIDVPLTVMLRRVIVEISAAQVARLEEAGHAG